MSDDHLTDEALARIAAAVADSEGRWRWVQIATTDAAALLAEVARLKAENAEMEDYIDNARQIGIERGEW